MAAGFPAGEVWRRLPSPGQSLLGSRALGGVRHHLSFCRPRPPSLIYYTHKPSCPAGLVFTATLPLKSTSLDIKSTLSMGYHLI